MQNLRPYIVVSRRGLYAFLLVACIVACGTFTVWAYGLAALLSLGIGIQSGIDLLQLGWQPRVSLQRHLRKRLLQGHEDPVLYSIENRCACPIRVSIHEAGTIAEYMQDETELVEILAHTTANLTHIFDPRIRGAMEFKGMYVVLAPGYGFFERRFYLHAPAQTLVYPDYTSIDKRGEIQLVQAKFVNGLRKTRIIGGESERTGVRIYTDGDAFRAIDFQATARSGRIMVKEYEVERGQNIFLAIDGGRLMTAIVANRSIFDHALGVALGISNVARSFGDRIGVHVFADKPLLTLPARSGAPHLAQIAQALRDLQPVHSESDYYSASAHIGRTFQKRGTIFVMSHLFDHLTIDSLLAAFKPLSRVHRVVFLFMDDGILEEYATQTITSSGQAVETAIALRLLRERNAAFHLLRKAGMEVLAHHAVKTGPAAIDAYLRIRQGRRL